MRAIGQRDGGRGAADFLDRDDIRITSYNVCYTKFLRSIIEQGQIEHILSASSPAGRGAGSWRSGETTAGVGATPEIGKVLG